MEYVDIEAGMTAFAKVMQWFAMTTLAPSRVWRSREYVLRVHDIPLRSRIREGERRWWSENHCMTFANAVIPASISTYSIAVSVLQDS